MGYFDWKWSNVSIIGIHFMENEASKKYTDQDVHSLNFVSLTLMPVKRHLYKFAVGGWSVNSVSDVLRSFAQVSRNRCRVPIVTACRDWWRMVWVSLPWESRWAWAASWAARKISSAGPVAPATEPTTPPALFRSLITCHALIPANETKKTNRTRNTFFCRDQENKDN